MPEHVVLLFPFFCAFIPFSFILHSRDVFVFQKCPKAILIGSLAAFVNIIKAELGLALVFFSANSFLPAAGGGVLPGEVVLSAL